MSLKIKLEKDYNIKIFTENIEQKSLEQIYLLLKQDSFKDSKIRIMPDVHSRKRSSNRFYRQFR